jgi:sugar transferase (PEP-CTERM/EpsH1 system associated)
VGRLNVLALVTRLPVPPWRGDQVRAYHQLRRLASRHRITVCALTLAPPEPRDVEALRREGLAVTAVPLGLAGAPAALGRAAVTGLPFQVALFDRARARRAVAALVADGAFDVVHAQLVRTGRYLPASGGPPVVLDLVDALSANFARRAARDRGPLAWVSALESRRLARYERTLVTRVRVTLVVAASERDAVGGGGVRVVPNGVDLETFRPGVDPREAGRVVFAGNLGYFPNVDAARWLADDIMPRVRAAVPGATLRLVGARPARAVRGLATRPGVALAADVPSMAAELARAAITIIPMRSGSGLQNKVLEAMACGTPVVTTPQAAAPLGLVDGEHVAVAADANGLAAAAAELLRTPGRARAQAVAARRLVEHRFGWDASAAAVEQAWEDARRS